MKLVRNRPTRYSPDQNTLASLHFGPSVSTLRNEQTGLVVDVSALGCKILIVNEETKKDGTAAFVAIGESDYVRAKLKWSKELERGIFLLGFEFEENR